MSSAKLEREYLTTLGNADINLDYPAGPNKPGRLRVFIDGHLYTLCAS